MIENKSNGTISEDTVTKYTAKEKKEIKDIYRELVRQVKWNKVAASPKSKKLTLDSDLINNKFNDRWTLEKLINKTNKLKDALISYDKIMFNLIDDVSFDFFRVHTLSIILIESYEDIDSSKINL